MSVATGSVLGRVRAGWGARGRPTPPLEQASPCRRRHGNYALPYDRPAIYAGRNGGGEGGILLSLEQTARALIGMTLGFHIILAVMGMGFPLFILWAEYLGIKHRDQDFLELARRGSKAFVVRIGCRAQDARAHREPGNAGRPDGFALGDWPPFGYSGVSHPYETTQEGKMARKRLTDEIKVPALCGGGVT